MFKFIGFVVVLVIAYVGFSSIQKWYAGDATPKETVNEVRNKLGEALTTEKSNRPAVESPAVSAAPVQAPQQKNTELDANQMMKQMMEEKK